MEEIVEIDGVLKRRFLKVGEAMGGMVHGTRIYTKDLRQHPEEYQAELGLFRRAGTVWISYGVPFIVPITAGMGTALVFGDILFAIMMVFLGG